MNDEPEVTRVVRSWLDEGVTALPDRVLESVLAQVPATQQRRARWPAWRSIAMSAPIRLAAAAAVVSILVVGVVPRTSGPGVADQAASPSPSAASSTAPSVAPSRSPGVLAPALVTGKLVWAPGTQSDGWQEEVETQWGFRQRVRTRSARSIMTDPRLSGDVTVIDNADRFLASPAPGDSGVLWDGYIGDVLWGSVSIASGPGTWTGTLVGTSDETAGGTGVSYIELVGSGAYEGLSAVLFERENTPIDWDWYGVIFAGDLPPDR